MALPLLLPFLLPFLRRRVFAKDGVALCAFRDTCCRLRKASEAAARVRRSACSAACRATGNATAGILLTSLLLPLSQPPVSLPLSSSQSIKGCGNSACITRVTTAPQEDVWCAARSAGWACRVVWR